MHYENELLGIRVVNAGHRSPAQNVASWSRFAVISLPLCVWSFGLFQWNAIFIPCFYFFWKQKLIVQVLSSQLLYVLNLWAQTQKKIRVLLRPENRLWAYHSFFCLVLTQLLDASVAVRQITISEDSCHWMSWTCCTQSSLCRLKKDIRTFFDEIYESYFQRCQFIMQWRLQLSNVYRQSKVLFLFQKLVFYAKWVFINFVQIVQTRKRRTCLLSSVLKDRGDHIFRVIP